VVGRIMAERMRSSLGQPVIIENVTGADGSIGVGRAARATPDGYTIDIGPMSLHVLNGAFYSLPYDVLNDFAPIAALHRSALIIPARKTMPAKDLRELIAWLKANPNKASAAVVTIGGRLLATVFQKETGTQFVLVPYRGVAPAMQDLVAGHIDLLFFDSPRTSLPLVRAGTIKAYAMTSDTHLAAAPDIPTFAEMGLPALSYSEWTELFAPRGTPRDIIDRLNAAAVEALADPAVRSRIIEFGAESNKLRKRSMLCKEPTPRSGGRSSRPPASERNKHLTLWLLLHLPLEGGGKRAPFARSGREGVTAALQARRRD
jgi:tripartite-type tricarboxylate transporter receptor subunit TctC